MTHTDEPIAEPTPAHTRTHDQAFSLAGKRALVTGGGSGIGFNIARCLAEAGATVVITGRREQPLRDAVATLTTGRSSGSVQYMVNDVTERHRLDGLVADIENTHGPIDILVNNAGINLKKPALEVTNEEFDRIVHTNLNSVFSLTRACAGRMVERGTGCIIMISSMAAYYGIDRVVAYAASKSAVEGMVKVLASEFSGRGGSGQCHRTGLHRNGYEQDRHGGRSRPLCARHAPDADGCVWPARRRGPGCRFSGLRCRPLRYRRVATGGWW